MMKYFIYAIAAIHLGCSTSLGKRPDLIANSRLLIPSIFAEKWEKNQKIKRIF